MNVHFRPAAAALAAILFFAAFGVADAQTRNASAATPAYTEVLLKRTELQAELESLLVEYTEEYPRVAELRYLIFQLDSETGRLNAVKPADAGKLTEALGRLMVRKAELATDLWKLLKVYKEGHPDVKKAAKRVETFETAIVRILGST